MDKAEIAMEKEKAKFEKDRADMFAAMVKTPAWQVYVDLLNAQIGERTQNLFGPTPPGGEYAEQHNKGAVYGLLLARDLPSVTIAAVKEAASSEPADGD